MQFIIPVAGNDMRSRRHSTTLHIMVAVVLFCIGVAGVVLFWFTSVSRNFKSPYFPFALFGLGCIITAICIIWISFKGKGKQNNMGLRLLELVLLLGGAVLFFLNDWYRPAGMFTLLAIVVLFAIFWEKRTGGQKRIIINDDGIELPEAFKSYGWAEIEMVLLRHNVLTIETTRNHRRQENIVPGNETDPEILEAYCKAQIEKALPERRKEW